MSDVDQIHHQFMALVPNLRAFARSLCHNADYADDLVQLTLLKAWNHRAKFVEGTNLKAWLFAILRNSYLSEIRKKKYEVDDKDGDLAEELGVRGAQIGHMDLMDFSRAFEKLSREQREVVILIGAEGLSYDEVALMCGCAIGTIKSRVNRARAKLCELMGVEGAADFGPDQREQARAKAPGRQSRSG
jgi:RNA polymerase sigma-70 factor (ECF subfamily)